VEETVIHFIDLPEGEDYVWLADANVVGLARRIQHDDPAICRALSKLQDEWRRNVLHAVS
jgi:hypothetical protein